MNYTILKKLLKKDELTKEEIWKFFNVDSELKMEETVRATLNTLKIKIDDGLIYIGPEMIYQSSIDHQHNIFYEKLMVVSYFLKGFADYNDELTEAFIKSLGLVKFVFIAEDVLENNKQFSFYKNAYLEYKKDKYFREQTDRMVNIFDAMTEEIKNVDFDEIKKLTEEFKNNN